MIIFIGGLLMVIIVEIGMNFISIEKAATEFMEHHKFHGHKKPSEGISSAEKENLDLLRSWYQGTFLFEAGVIGLYYGWYFFNIQEFKTHQMKTENIVLSTVRFKKYALEDS